MALQQYTNLNFDDIKTSIKDYLRANSNFTDFDFEGSNLSVLINLLAYNTYITAFNTNMAVNETFIDSATLRENVVSLARNIGYVPRSKRAAKAKVDYFIGDLATRRALIYTLGFTAKTYLFGPVAESSSGLIKKVQVDYSTNTDIKNSKREVRYTVTPDPVSAGPDDDFGFSETTSFFSDSKSYSPTRQTDI